MRFLGLWIWSFFGFAMVSEVWSLLNEVLSLSVFDMCLCR